MRRRESSDWAKRWWQRAGIVLPAAVLVAVACWGPYARAQGSKLGAEAKADVTAPATGQAKAITAPSSPAGSPGATSAATGAPSTASPVPSAAGASAVPGSEPGVAVTATPTGSPASPATASTSASAAPAAMDATTYVVRLRDLESRVDELKEQIRRSHTRLSLLSDTILSGGIGGAEADIVFRNEMSNAFRVVSVLFVLDGAVMKKEQDDTGELAAKKSIPVYDGPLTPGDHTLQVVVVFQGHGYGVFSYLRAHKYTTKHTHSFTVTEGKVARIEATAFEKGGVTTPIDQRPNVRFTEKIVGNLEAKTGAH